jgi:hypothetical protein
MNKPDYRALTIEARKQLTDAIAEHGMKSDDGGAIDSAILTFESQIADLVLKEHLGHIHDRTNSAGLAQQCVPGLTIAIRSLLSGDVIEHSFIAGRDITGSDILVSVSSSPVYSIMKDALAMAITWGAKLGEQLEKRKAWLDATVRIRGAN